MDLKALWRLYECGCLHGFVRLKWGFLDQLLYVSSWRVGHLPKLWDVLPEAARTREILEVVLGSPPGWEEPWSRGLRVRILAVREGDIEVEYADSGERGFIQDYDVFAVRPSPREPAPPFPWPEGGSRVS